RRERGGRNRTYGSYGTYRSYQAHSLAALVAGLEGDLHRQFVAVAEDGDIHNIFGLLGAEHLGPGLDIRDRFAVPFDQPIAGLDPGRGGGCAIEDIADGDAGLVVGVGARGDAEADPAGALGRRGKAGVGIRVRVGAGGLALG